MNRNITFTIGEEFVPIIETTPEQIHNSLFREIYDKAFYGINDFLNDRKKSPNEKEVNNIFAFIGERGSGKSSCMQSMGPHPIEQRVMPPDFRHTHEDS